MSTGHIHSSACYSSSASAPSFRTPRQQSGGVENESQLRAHMNEGGQEWIQEAKSCHSDSYAVHDQRAHEVLHDDAAASSRNPQGLDELERSLPIRMTSALSRATSVPDPMAIPTFGLNQCGGSLMPSPTIATLRPFLADHLPNLLSAPAAVLPLLRPLRDRAHRSGALVSPLNRTVFSPICRIAATAFLASGRKTSAMRMLPRTCPRERRILPRPIRTIAIDRRTLVTPCP